MPTVFITGCSTGLGKATAILFAKNGWDVVATMRKPENEKDLTEFANISLVKLDVTDLKNIEDVVANTLAKTSVDVVVNNAGYGQAGAVEATSDEAIQQQLNTNILGVIRVTKAFVPHFRERRSGVFITITSIGGYVTFPFNSLYHTTKWALEGFSDSLQFELSRFNVLVKNVAPGGILTEFANRSLSSWANHDAYAEDMEKILAVYKNFDSWGTLSTAAQIAETIFEAATDGKQQVHYIAGEDAKKYYELRNQIGSEAFRAVVEEQFFGKIDSK